MGVYKSKRTDFPEGVEMQTTLSAEDALQRALEMPLGMGIILRFYGPKERDTFRWRCYHILWRDRKNAKKRGQPDPWGKVTILRMENKLWIGLFPFKFVQLEYQEGTINDFRRLKDEVERQREAADDSAPPDAEVVGGEL